jgi:hypothetical protein
MTRVATLSVTVIAKNEAHNLPRALASVADVVDEIIVTDTGSTDRTMEIAREFGARVAQFDWSDDFSAAHNYCNSLATCDWLFMLDCDEELLPESRAELARCLDEESAWAFAVIRQDLVEVERPDHFSEMWQVRLYRNRPDLKFAGRFHHQPERSLIEAAARDGLYVRESQVRLLHHGFVSGLRADKNRRAARLLALELEDRPGQFYYLVELGLTLLAVGDMTGHVRLAEAARMVIDDDPQVAVCRGQCAMLLEHTLACRTLPPGFPLSRPQARNLALERFPTAIPLLWQAAQDEHRHARFDRCAALLERILNLSETGGYDRTISFSPSIMGDDARLNLGVCLVRLGQLNRAKQCFRALLDSPTRGREAAENLKAIAALRRR